jgi:hypothetical protein
LLNWPFKPGKTNVNDEVDIENEKIYMIGVYIVKENKDVHLIEVIINEACSKIDAGRFTQEDPNRPPYNWQVAYNEYYLNHSGDEVIGDSILKPETSSSPARITFFFYFIDFNRPLLTPYGPVKLSKPTSMPARLKSIITFEEP